MVNDSRSINSRRCDCEIKIYSSSEYNIKKPSHFLAALELQNEVWTVPNFSAVKEEEELDSTALCLAHHAKRGLWQNQRKLKVKVIRLYYQNIFLFFPFFVFLVFFKCWEVSEYLKWKISTFEVI